MSVHNNCNIRCFVIVGNLKIFYVKIKFWSVIRCNVVWKKTEMNFKNEKMIFFSRLTEYHTWHWQCKYKHDFFFFEQAKYVFEMASLTSITDFSSSSLLLAVFSEKTHKEAEILSGRCFVKYILHCYRAEETPRVFIKSLVFFEAWN